MTLRYLKDNKIILWQAAFIICSTSWLLAPHLNHFLSYRTALISQYELPGQPYAWLFQTFDTLGGGLLLAVALWFRNMPGKKIGAWLLIIIGIGLVADPLLPTSCRLISGVCYEYFSPAFFLHALETTVTSVTIFGLSVWDSWQRRRVVSLGFVGFQVLYGLLFISQLATHARFNTASQLLYQASLIVWLAWFVRDYFVPGRSQPAMEGYPLIRGLFAAWSLLNGLLSIVVGFAHIRLLGRIRGLYFANDSAWLAQHAVVIGVILLYLSRHLLRGERRARHILLFIVGLETIKYSVIAPNPLLMWLYGLTFVGLFVTRDAFDRGTVALTWRIRVKEALLLTGLLLMTMLIALGILYRDSHHADIANASLDHFVDYSLRDKLVPDSRLESALLAHTISAFIAASAGLLLWVLFRPQVSGSAKPSAAELDQVRQLLARHSTNPEDFFKQWPADKTYFWNSNKTGFIAYRVESPIVFGLADPIAANRSARQALIRDFTAWARSQRLRVCFLPVYEPGLSLYKRCGLDSLQIGASALINIDSFLTDTINDKWWRWQKNRALKAGYQYLIANPQQSPSLHNPLRPVSNAWLSKDGRQERGFALGYFDEDYLQNSDIHYLMDTTGQILAFTNRLPVYKKLETASIDLIRYWPGANNAMPFLMLDTIESIKHEAGYKYFDLGFVPFVATKDPIVKVTRLLAGGRFSAKGLEQFKNKFDPNWQPNYMAYDGDLADLALVALALERSMEVTS